ncbi:MAG: hypothetical protein FWJ93_05015 [Micromonosporaceae bacterium]
MYAWIWRKLPFGLPGKIIGSLVLALGAAALLWYVVFPRIEPILLPFDDVQVGTEHGGPGDIGPGRPAGHGGPGGSDAPGDEFDIPYSTESNNPAPRQSR